MTTLELNPVSRSEVQQAKELITTRLGSGVLNIFINAGFIGHEAVRGCTGGRIAGFWGAHISSLNQISRAFRPLLIASHGTILNLVSHEMVIHDLIISKFHCSYCILFNPLIKMAREPPNAPVAMRPTPSGFAIELAP